MTLWSFSTWKEWCQRLDTWPRAMVFKLFLPAKLFVYFYGTCGGDRSLIYKERCMFAGPEHTLPTVLIQSQHLGDHFEKPQACGNQERRGWKGNTGKKDVMKMIKIIAAHFFWDLPVYQVPQKIPVCLRKKKKKTNCNVWDRVWHWQLKTLQKEIELFAGRQQARLSWKISLSLQLTLASIALLEWISLEWDQEKK